MTCFLDLRSFQFHDVFHLDNENRGEDMPTLIDRKVCLMHIPVTFTLFLMSWKINIILFLKLFHFYWIFCIQDNVFIISNPKSKFPVLQLDLRLGFMHSRLSPWVLVFLLDSCHLVCINMMKAYRSNLINFFYLQIDFRSSCCYCFCDLWWHCFCMCRATGLIIITFLFFFSFLSLSLSLFWKKNGKSLS